MVCCGLLLVPADVLLSVSGQRLCASLRRERGADASDGGCIRGLRPKRTTVTAQAHAQATTQAAAASTAWRHRTQGGRLLRNGEAEGLMRTG